MGTSKDFVAEEAVGPQRRRRGKPPGYAARVSERPAPRAVRPVPHLSSRTEVGEILIASGIETIVLQAGIVIGSGSASFEMIRHLTDRLPVMTTPKWVHNKIQPIAIDDALYYLPRRRPQRFRRRAHGTSAVRT